MCVLKVYNLCVSILALWRTPWLSMTDGALIPLVNTGDFWLVRTNSIPVSRSTPSYKGIKMRRVLPISYINSLPVVPKKKVWNVLLLFHFFSIVRHKASYKRESGKMPWLWIANPGGSDAMLALTIFFQWKNWWKLCSRQSGDRYTHSMTSSIFWRNILHFRYE